MWIQANKKEVLVQFKVTGRILNVPDCLKVDTTARETPNKQQTQFTNEQGLAEKEAQALKDKARIQVTEPSVEKENVNVEALAKADEA